MTAELTELGSFLDPTLAVPFRAKTYRIAAVDAETGLRLTRMLSAGVKAAQGEDVDPATIELVADTEELGFFETVLGTVYDELLADKAPFPAVKAIASTALMWHAQGFEQAKTFWDAEGKAPAPNRAQRRTATRTSMAAASTTKKPASRNTTTTPKATAARAANGRTS